MGGPPVTSRGGMVHLILSLCRQFEEAFGKAVDGGKGGGEQILKVFEERLGQNIQQLQFKKVSLLLVPPGNVCRLQTRHTARKEFCAGWPFQGLLYPYVFNAQLAVLAEQYYALCTTSVVTQPKAWRHFWHAAGGGA